MTIIGICGSSGSGKSLVCQLLKKKGFSVFDCDRVYARLISPPSTCLKEIVEHFGPHCLLSDGSLDRAYLGSLVFCDPIKREELNSITFKHITNVLEKQLHEKQRAGEKAFVIDAPLLFESKIHAVCHYTVGVIAPEEIKLARLRNRDHKNDELLKKRLAAQKSDHFLREHCDFVLDNKGTIEELKDGIEKILLCIKL